MNKFQEPSDIVLAAFAQVQSITEILNDYSSVTQHQEISAVSTSLCDNCHRNQQLKSGKLKSSSSQQQQQQKQKHSDEAAAAATASIVDSNNSVGSESNVGDNDEDGYCEIDELRTNLQVTATPQQQEVKRQSTISADSIPEETEHEINQELLVSVDEGCNEDDDDEEEIGEGVIEINDAYDSTSQVSVIIVHQKMSYFVFISFIFFCF